MRIRSALSIQARCEELGVPTEPLQRRSQIPSARHKGAPVAQLKDEHQGFFHPKMQGREV